MTAFAGAIPAWALSSLLRPLPRTVRPVQDEILQSYLQRLAQANSLDPRHFTEYLKGSKNLSAPIPPRRTSSASSTGVGPETPGRSSAAADAGRRARAADHGRGLRSRVPVRHARGSRRRPARGRRRSPAALRLAGMNGPEKKQDPGGMQAEATGVFPSTIKDRQW
jgi:hypothetical protein